MSKNINHINETVVDEALTRQVATIALTGSSVSEIAKQLAITPAAVRKIQNSDKFKDLVKATSEESLAPALAEAKAKLSKIAGKGVRVLEKAMDNYLEAGTGGRDAIQAAMTALRAVGLHEEAEKQQDTNLTIVLPSTGSDPLTIEVPNESGE